MKWRIAETTGSPDFSPRRWRADAGLYRFIIGRCSAPEDLDAGATHWSGMLAASGSDYVLPSSVRAHKSLDEAKAACQIRLIEIIKELEMILEEEDAPCPEPAKS